MSVCIGQCVKYPATIVAERRFQMCYLSKSIDTTTTTKISQAKALLSKTLLKLQMTSEQNNNINSTLSYSSEFKMTKYAIQ